MVHAPSGARRESRRASNARYSKTQPSAAASLQSVEHGLFDDPPVAQMLDDYPLQQRRCNPAVPDAIRIHHDDRPAAADAKAWRLTPLHPGRPEQQSFPLKQRRQQRVELSPAMVGRTKPADTDKHVSGVGIHKRR